jgi:signal peptidase I
MSLKIKNWALRRNAGRRSYLTLKTLRNTVTGILAVIVLGLVILNFSPDYHMAVVKSESMQPCINMGDLIITGRPGSWFCPDIRPGTIISYKVKDVTVTHRVVSVDINGTLVTRGDAVKVPDAPAVQPSQVAGIYLFRLPKVGYLTNFLHTKTGWYLCLVLPASLIAGWIIKEIIRESFSPAGHKTEEK